MKLIKKVLIFVIFFTIALVLVNSAQLNNSLPELDQKMEKCKSYKEEVECNIDKKNRCFWETKSNLCIRLKSSKDLKKLLIECGNYDKKNSCNSKKSENCEWSEKTKKCLFKNKSEKSFTIKTPGSKILKKP